jgi:hypothetical protein
MKVDINIFKHIIAFLSDSAPIQIHNVYIPGRIYSEKTGYKHKWHKLYFTQQQRTNKNGPVFKCTSSSSSSS